MLLADDGYITKAELDEIGVVWRCYFIRLGTFKESLKVNDGNNIIRYLRKNLSCPHKIINLILDQIQWEVEN